MRPTSAELLRSARRSLVDVVIPNVTDSWARYVAKGMDKVLEHVELRCRLEYQLLVEDTRELRELFGHLAEELDAPESGNGPVAILGELSAELRSCLADRAVVDGPTAMPDQVLEENETHRAVLVSVIESLDEAARGDEALAERLAPLQAEVRATVRRELDRDLQLATPTFMLFGPPPPLVKGGGTPT